MRKHLYQQRQLCLLYYSLYTIPYACYCYCLRYYYIIYINILILSYICYVTNNYLFYANSRLYVTNTASYFIFNITLFFGVLPAFSGLLYVSLVTCYEQGNTYRHLRLFIRRAWGERIKQA